MSGRLRVFLGEMCHCWMLTLFGNQWSYSECTPQLCLKPCWNSSVKFNCVCESVCLFLRAWWEQSVSVYKGHGFVNGFVIGWFDACLSATGNALSQPLISQHDWRLSADELLMNVLFPAHADSLFVLISSLSLCSNLSLSHTSHSQIFRLFLFCSNSSSFSFIFLF